MNELSLGKPKGVEDILFYFTIEEDLGACANTYPKVS